MEEIRQIVEKLDLEKLKQEYLENQEYLFLLERKMANLTLQYEVGWYAHRLDEMEEISRMMEDASLEEWRYLYKRMKYTKYLNNRLEEIPEVILYKNTRELYNKIKKENHRYHQTLQKDFRDQLRTVKIPPYYVSQGNYAKHIVFPEQESSLAFVYPEKDLSSKRKYRHFYNRLSFKYLESVSNTHNLELDHNEVGKIKTLIP